MCPTYIVHIDTHYAFHAVSKHLRERPDPTFETFKVSGEVNLKLRQSPDAAHLHIRLTAPHDHDLMEEGAGSFSRENISILHTTVFLHMIYGVNKK